MFPNWGILLDPPFGWKIQKKVPMKLWPHFLGDIPMKSVVSETSDGRTQHTQTLPLPSFLSTKWHSPTLFTVETAARYYWGIVDSFRRRKSEQVSLAYQFTYHLMTADFSQENSTVSDRWFTLVSNSPLCARMVGIVQKRLRVEERLSKQKVSVRRRATENGGNQMYS